MTNKRYITNIIDSNMSINDFRNFKTLARFNNSDTETTYIIDVNRDKHLQLDMYKGVIESVGLIPIKDAQLWINSKGNLIGKI